MNVKRELPIVKPDLPAERYIHKFKKVGGLETQEAVWMLEDLIKRLQELERKCDKWGVW